jgi:hypothetical protein
VPSIKEKLGLTKMFVPLSVQRYFFWVVVVKVCFKSSYYSDGYTSLKENILIFIIKTMIKTMEIIVLENGSKFFEKDKI